MADNFAFSEGSGKTGAADDIGGVLFQRVKVTWGVDGTANDASASNPLPTVQTGALPAGSALIGSATAVGAAAHDAAASGNPVLLGGYASSTAPSNVSANADAVRLWALLNGALAVNLTAAGALIGGDATNGLDVDVTRMPYTTIGQQVVTKDVTLSLDTSAYAAGDVLADTQVVSGAMRANDATGGLVSVMVIDQDDQRQPFTLFFLSANVAMGTENAAPSISDANAVEILGYVDVFSSDYKDLGGVSVASYRNIGLPLKPATGTADIYVAAVNGSGTPTYTASGVKLRLGIVQS